MSASMCHRHLIHNCRDCYRSFLVEAYRKLNSTELAELRTVNDTAQYAAPQEWKIIEIGYAVDTVLEER